MIARLAEKRCFHCKSIAGSPGHCRLFPPTPVPNFTEQPVSAPGFNGLVVRNVPADVTPCSPPINPFESWCTFGYRRNWRRWLAFPKAFRAYTEAQLAKFKGVPQEPGAEAADAG